jgi:hypothetical protein
VSPEEQAQYDKFVDNAFKLIYSDEGLPKVLERIKASPSPVEAIANITASTVMRLQDSAEKAGAPLSPDVLYNGGIEILEDLADMAEEAGAHSFTDEEMEAAMYQTLDVFQKLAQDAGLVDNDAAAQEVEMLKKTEMAGGIDQVLPGLTQKGEV